MAEIGGADEHVVVNQSPRFSFQSSSLSYDCEYPFYNSSLNFNAIASALLLGLDRFAIDWRFPALLKNPPLAVNRNYTNLEKLSTYRIIIVVVLFTIVTFTRHYKMTIRVSCHLSIGPSMCDWNFVPIFPHFVPSARKVYLRSILLYILYCMYTMLNHVPACSLVTHLFLYRTKIFVILGWLRWWHRKHNTGYRKRDELNFRLCFKFDIYRFFVVRLLMGKFFGRWKQIPLKLRRKLYVWATKPC